MKTSGNIRSIYRHSFSEWRPRRFHVSHWWIQQCKQNYLWLYILTGIYKFIFFTSCEWVLNFHLRYGHTKVIRRNVLLYLFYWSESVETIRLFHTVTTTVFLCRCCCHHEWVQYPCMTQWQWKNGYHVK